MKLSNLRYLRLKHDYSLQEVADKIGTTKSNLSNIETGKTKLSDEFKVLLLELYGVGIDELTG